MECSTTRRLTLYVAGASPQSGKAVRAVASLLKDDPEFCNFTVVDVHRSPELAYREGVLVVPAVVFTTPDSKILVSGNLSMHGLRMKLGAL